MKHRVMYSNLEFFFLLIIKNCLYRYRIDSMIPFSALMEVCQPFLRISLLTKIIFLFYIQMYIIIKC